jgi:hypothetical protein
MGGSIRVDFIEEWSNMWRSFLEAEKNVAFSLYTGVIHRLDDHFPAKLVAIKD